MYTQIRSSAGPNKRHKSSGVTAISPFAEALARLVLLISLWVFQAQKALTFLTAAQFRVFDLCLRWKG
jgi:hypothetical protein